MNDAVGTQLRQIVERYGPEVCEDMRRIEALLRDLSGEHRREVAVLVGAVREGVPAELLASRNSALPAMLGERLARKLQDNLGMADDAARWAVSTWALALDVTALALPVPASGRQPPQQAADGPAAAQARTRIAGLLGEAISAALQSEGAQALYLTRVARALAATDPDRAARLLDDAERLTRPDHSPTILLSDRAVLAQTDPDRAERIARSTAGKLSKARALAAVAKALAATDPNRARRLLDDAARLARIVTDQSEKAYALTEIAEAWSQDW
jgi:hypothetical protein